MFEKTKQDQNVSGNGQAIQAQGDVTINHGMSLTQMAEVIREVRNITDTFTVEAMVKVEARAAEFEQAVLSKFADTKETSSAAFREPDFQLMLSGAQRAYARSGDEAVKETLVDIIARRSLAKEATREALTLNDAAERAAKLTEAEYASLSLCYVLRYTVNHGVNSPESMAGYINNTLLPLARQVSQEDSSLWHIEAQSCGNVGMGEVALSNIFRNSYSGCLGVGVPLEELQAMFVPEVAIMMSHVVVKVSPDSELVRPPTQTKEQYLKQYKGFGFDADALTQIWGRYEATIPGDLQAQLSRLSPDVHILFHVWSNTSLKSLTLNSVGIAIGHANARRTVNFNTPLSVWIK